MTAVIKICLARESGTPEAHESVVPGERRTNNLTTDRRRGCRSRSLGMLTAGNRPAHYQIRRIIVEPTKTRMETRQLPVELTTDELNQRRDILASLVREDAQVEQRKKDDAGGFSKRLKEIKQSMSAIAREIRNKAEDREVPIIRQKNFTLGVEEIIRTDTAEVVDSRALGPDEKQTQMFSATPRVEIKMDAETGEIKGAKG